MLTPTKVVLRTIVATVVMAGSAHAHNVFKTALTEKYGFKSVSCYTCHLHRDQTADFSEADLAAYKENSKAFYNDFGKRFAPHTAGKKIAERVEAMDAAKKAARAADTEAEEEQLKAEEEKIEAELIQDITGMLEKIKDEKDEATGKTYDELLKAGEIEGVKYPE